MDDSIGGFGCVAGFMAHWTARPNVGKLPPMFNAALSRAYGEPERVGRPGTLQAHTATTTILHCLYTLVSIVFNAYAVCVVVVLCVCVCVCVCVCECV